MFQVRSGLIIECQISHSRSSSKVRVSLKKIAFPQIQYITWLGLHRCIYIYMMKLKATLLAHCLLASSKLKATLLAQCHVAGSVPRSWLNATQLAQRLVAGSAPRSWLNFFSEKKKTSQKLSRLHALEPARQCVMNPANTQLVFVLMLSHSSASST